MNAALADVRCPACGSAFAQRVPYPSLQQSSALAFNEIALCSVCGLGMAVPQRAQDELDAFYASGEYWSGTVGDSRVQVLHERNQCRHRVRLALDRLPARKPLRVLDVGAGHGWTAYWLSRFAPGTVESFEFVEPDDARSHEIAARSDGLRVRRVQSLPAAADAYELIFLNHVLEHVADPVAAVECVRALLAPDGIAYFEMPQADYRFKRDVFPHTWFFTHDALEHLGRHAGVTQILREAFGPSAVTAPASFCSRAAFRFAAALDLAALAGSFDDRVWRYQANRDGIWLRWIIRR